MKIYFFVIFLVSCAHYSMASSASTIFIPPFTVEAETDLNGAQLAMTLVSRLEHFGLNARFGTVHRSTSDAALPTFEKLECHVLTDQIINSSNNSGVGFTRIKLVCQNGDKEFTHLLTSGANMDDTLDNRKVLVQSAATEGIESLSVEISKHFISVQRER